MYLALFPNFYKMVLHKFKRHSLLFFNLYFHNTKIKLKWCFSFSIEYSIKKNTLNSIADN